MAMAGEEKVLLIDCDLRRNTLRGLSPVSNQGGLAELLGGKATFDQVVTSDAAQGLDILPLSGPAFTARDLFGDRMKQLLEALRDQYDWIILDGPPALVVADARTLAALADRVIFAVRWSKTSSFAARTAIERFRTDGDEVAGAFLTLVPPAARTSLGGQDPSYYYKAYGQYYHD
jgi:Mrp family chromosome partitioning ATPase